MLRKVGIIINPLLHSVGPLLGSATPRFLGGHSRPSEATVAHHWSEPNRIIKIEIDLGPAEKTKVTNEAEVPYEASGCPLEGRVSHEIM